MDTIIIDSSYLKTRVLLAFTASAPSIPKATAITKFTSHIIFTTKITSNYSPTAYNLQDHPEIFGMRSHQDHTPLGGVLWGTVMFQ